MKNETINNQSVTLEYRSMCINAQREALRMHPESVIKLNEENIDLQGALDNANKMLRKFRNNEAILSTKYLSL